MKSIPIIEGLTQNTMDDYNQLLSDLNSFSVSYMNYISQCTDNDCSQVPPSYLSDLQSKLNNLGTFPNQPNAVSGSLTKFYTDVSNNYQQAATDPVALNKVLQQTRNQVNSEKQMLTDVQNSVAGDSYLKQRSSYYMNAALCVGAGCLLYYTFHQISTTK
jgi:hypothetical protein